MKKIVTITMVKDEEDIIEVFARYTLKYAYKMVVIDNGCSDATIPILENLISEGKPIELYSEADCYYDQERIENKYLKKVAEEESFDFIIPLDADEFLYPENGDFSILDNLSDNQLILIDWLTYCLDKDKTIVNPIKDISLVRRGEKPYTKIIVPKKIITKDFNLEMGHHDAVTEFGKVTESRIKMAHFPVRSKEQIRHKMFMAKIGQLMSENESVSAGHIMPILHDIEIGTFDVVKHSKEYALREGEEKNVYYDDSLLFMPWDEVEIATRYSEIYIETEEIKLFKFMEIMALQNIADRYREKESIDIIAFGPGKYFRELMNSKKIEKYNLIMCVDSNEEKEYQKFEERLIIAPDKLKYIRFDKIVINQKYEREIRDTLKRLYIDESKIVREDELI